MTNLQTLTEARDRAKANLLAAYAIRDDGREVHLGQYEQAYTAACQALAAAELDEDEEHYEPKLDFVNCRGE